MRSWYLNLFSKNAGIHFVISLFLLILSSSALAEAEITYKIKINADGEIVQIADENGVPIEIGDKSERPNLLGAYLISGDIQHTHLGNKLDIQHVHGGSINLTKESNSAADPTAGHCCWRNTSTGWLCLHGFCPPH